MGARAGVRRASRRACGESGVGTRHHESRARGDRAGRAPPGDEHLRRALQAYLQAGDDVPQRDVHRQRHADRAEQGPDRGTLPLRSSLRRLGDGDPSDTGKERCGQIASYRALRLRDLGQPQRPRRIQNSGERPRCAALRLRGDHAPQSDWAAQRLVAAHRAQARRLSAPLSRQRLRVSGRQGRKHAVVVLRPGRQRASRPARVHARYRGRTQRQPGVGALAPVPKDRRHPYQPRCRTARAAVRQRRASNHTTRAGRHSPLACARAGARGRGRGLPRPRAPSHDHRSPQRSAGVQSRAQTTLGCRCTAGAALARGGFLSGATKSQARQYAQRLARGGTVVEDPPHVPGGLPHFHIEGNGRSGHIFYGDPPPGEFFGAR